MTDVDSREIAGLAAVLCGVQRAEICDGGIGRLSGEWHCVECVVLCDGGIGRLSGEWHCFFLHTIY